MTFTPFMVALPSLVIWTSEPEKAIDITGRAIASTKYDKYFFIILVYRKYEKLNT
jgi:hypothetical protein